MDDFKGRKVNKRLKCLISENITPLLNNKEGISLKKRFEHAAWIAEWRNCSSKDVGSLYLRAAWCCDDGKEKEEQYYRLKTISFFERALQRNEIHRDKVALYTYLIGENYRRVGEQDRAAWWFDRVIASAGSSQQTAWLVNLAHQQKTNPKEFIRGEEISMVAEDELSLIDNRSNEIGDIDSFIELCPATFNREMIVDFESMEMRIVTLKLGPFVISKYPVTNRQYYRFMRETRYRPIDRSDYSDRIFLYHWCLGQDKYPTRDKWFHPVTFVSFDDACAYAEFAGGRLPTYQEWLYAAFGNTGNRFPWGDTFSADRCNVRESDIGGTTPVGQYSPQGDSPIGCTDMVGNVWEWTSTPFGDEEEMFVAVGTGWDHYSFQTEIPLDRSYRNRSVGFRVARDL